MKFEHLVGSERVKVTLTDNCIILKPLLKPRSKMQTKQLS